LVGRRPGDANDGGDRRHHRVDGRLLAGTPEPGLLLLPLFAPFSRGWEKSKGLAGEGAESGESLFKRKGRQRDGRGHCRVQTKGFFRRPVCMEVADGEEAKVAGQVDAFDVLVSLDFLQVEVAVPVLDPGAADDA
jgi:hypothetical protein